MIRNARWPATMLALGLMFVIPSCDSGEVAAPAEPDVAVVSGAYADYQENEDLSEVAQFIVPPPAKGLDRVVAQIGPEGGSLRLHDFEVIVPPGAVTKSTRFEIRLMPEPARKAHAYARFFPHNATFAVPLTLRLPLETTESAGTDASVLWWNSNAWEQMPTTPTADGRIETTTDHFSTYATQKMRGITMIGG